MVSILNQNTKKILLGVIFTFSLFFLPITCSNLTEEAFTIIQDPSESKIVINNSINVTVISNQPETISSIILFYCSLEPIFICHFPNLEMVKNNQGNFFTVFTPEYDVNTIFGYHLRIHMENGSNFEFPNNLTNSSDFIIRQGSDNNYYFELLLVDSLISENNTPWLSIESLFALTLFIRKKKKIRQKRHYN